MPLFVCLFVVCSGRFVATSVRYLTLFSRSRVFSQPPITSFSVFIFLLFYYSSCLPFYLPLFVSPLPNRSVQIYTPVECRSDVENFHCHRYLYHLVVSSAFLLLLSSMMIAPRQGFATGENGTRCLPSDLLLQDRGYNPVLLKYLIGLSLLARFPCFGRCCVVKPPSRQILEGKAYTEHVQRR